jgi:hypothetical protein
MKPPKAKSVRSAKDPKVLATIMFLPAAAINRNSADAIWLISKSRKYCLKSLKKKTPPCYNSWIRMDSCASLHKKKRIFVYLSTFGSNPIT